MKINTSRFGEIDIIEELIFNFIEPILGYENLTKFALIDHMSDSPFKWLQSVQDPDIAFPVAFPGYFNLNYEFVIPEEDANKLELKDSENLLSFNIVCIPQGNPIDSTMNLIGPIIINVLNKKAMQLVLVNSNHSVRHKLFPNGLEGLTNTSPETDQPKAETNEPKKPKKKNKTH